MRLACVRVGGNIPLVGWPGFRTGRTFAPTVSVVSPPRDPMPDLRDQLQATLGSTYRIDRELGGGGMSRVFVATETALRREVVVKVLPPELVAGVNIERFHREILLAAGLQHPHIVPVLAAGETAGLPWFTMPFLPGESLRQRIARGALGIGEVLSILRDVARALAHAHARGVIHRDIKPDNVLLNDGSAVVTDFGIAKALNAARSERPTSESRGALTQVGTSIGTPTYMAPEQAAADPDTDARADLYSFGCLAYELLTGRPPFSGLSPQKLLAAHMTETPQPVGELRRDTPPLLGDLVMRCLEKEPAARPRSASDIVHLLDIAAVGSADSHHAASAVLLGGPVRLRVALALWALTCGATYILAKAAIVGIGLPSWVLPGALTVAALGLPLILFTAFVHRAARRALTTADMLTPGGSTARRGTMATMAVKASPHVSWRRTVRWSAMTFGGFALLVAIFMGLRAMGIGPAGSLFAAGALSERDKLLIADFRIVGDSSLAPVVTEAVRTSLGQSAVLSILSPGAVAAALERMQRPATSRVDATLGREIAQREGVKAVVSGDVTPLGTGFVISMRLVSADSGITLASFHETADTPRDLLPTLDKLARQLRERAGESLKAVQGSPPLGDVTTASLDALRKYAEAARAHDIENNYDKSIALLKQAIQLDTTFAMAYRKLWASMKNAGYGDEASTPALVQAYRYRQRLTEHERLLLEGFYFDRGPGRDRARGMASYEALLARYPANVNALLALGQNYTYRGELARADSLYARARRLEPGDQIVFASQLWNLMYWRRLDEAWDTVRATQKRDPANVMISEARPYLLWLQGLDDSAESDLRAKIRSGGPALRVTALLGLTRLAETRGRLHEAERILAEMRTADSIRGGTLRPLDDSISLAHADAWYRGQPARAASRLDAALARYPLRAMREDETRPDMFVAVAYARARRPDRAREILAQWNADVRDTSLKRWMEPFRHEALGEIALAENKPRIAIDEFRLASRRPDGPVEECTACHDAQLAMAFERVSLPDSAIAAFERSLAWPPLVTPYADQYYRAYSHQRLGELYEARGDLPKAIAHSSRFVELWKNADPELQPRVAKARQQLARLAGEHKR
jgi:eukaryotic-like serine/threonine-protein kinase